MAIKDDDRADSENGHKEATNGESDEKAGPRVSAHASTPDEEEDEADPALDPGSEHGANVVVKSTSGLQRLEDKPEPPDVRDPHENDEHHGLAHTTPVMLLVGILAALLVLTIVTVAVTKVDLGGQGNLVVAMVIATIKAALVVMYFMHLRWDRKVHLVLFLSSVLFVILFLSMTLTDRGEYQHSIDQLEEAQATAK